jgi:hypothetical protein
MVGAFCASLRPRVQHPVQPIQGQAVDPDKGDHIQIDLANASIDRLISVPTQEMIGQFGVAEFGAPRFTPDSVPWREAHP